MAELLGPLFCNLQDRKRRTLLTTQLQLWRDPQWIGQCNLARSDDQNLTGLSFDNNLQYCTRLSDEGFLKVSALDQTREKRLGLARNVTGDKRDCKVCTGRGNQTCYARCVYELFRF